MRERTIALARGTRDWRPGEYQALARIEDELLGVFAAAGYQRIRTPILEPVELHERKSGAGIVAKLFTVDDPGHPALCLRPELTASIVRAYTGIEPAPEIPWRVASTGVVFRRERTPDAETLREFTQVGVELLGAQGVEADAEVIALACRAAAKVGLEPRVRIGHVGVILELLAHSGLPPAAQSALVEMISEAAAEGRDVRSLRSALGRLEAWIHTGEEAESILPAVEPGDEPGVDRLFRQLVPDVMGRRSGHEVVARLRRKWELAHGLEHVLTRLESELASIAQLRGPASDVLTKLEKEQARLAPETAKSLGDLLRLLDSAGIDPARIDLDLGFGRGIGFYSQTIFELSVSNGAESIEICGGGRYDGLARVFGSKRDEHGLGFAFGLERLASILAARTRSHKP